MVPPADGRVSYRDLKGDRVYLSDTCVPISNIAQMISETEADFLKAGFPCIICAHIADGNFHCCIPYQPKDYGTVKEIETRMIKRALSLEGTVSGEHGVGVGKIDQILLVRTSVPLCHVFAETFAMKYAVAAFLHVLYAVAVGLNVSVQRPTVPLDAR